MELARGLAAAAVLLNLGACADLGALVHLHPSAGADIQRSAPLAHSFAQTSVLGHIGADASTVEPHVQLPDLSSSAPEIIRGPVSWYGPRFAGRKTANGEIFDPRELTMAHRKLPFNTRVRVTNPDTGESVVVRVNDRGPYVGDRVADLSHAAATRIGMVKSGVIAAELEILSNDESGYAAAGRASPSANDAP